MAGNRVDLCGGDGNLMPKRVDGLFPTDPAWYEPLPERAFLNPFNLASGYQALDLPEFAFTVPAEYMYSLPNIIHGDPTVAANFSASTGAGGTGTAFTPTRSEGALGAYDVRVRPATGLLEFNSARVGSVVFVRYRSITDNWDAATRAQVYHATRRLDMVASEYKVAGAVVIPGPGYVTGGLVYQAVPSAMATAGWLWIYEGAAAYGTVLVMSQGLVYPRRTMPMNVPIYGGINGEVTWDGDTDDNCKLADGDIRIFIGHSENGSVLKLRPPVPVRWQS